MPFAGQGVRSCASQLKLLHGKEAELRVARQLRWARGRGNEHEIAFWDAVLKDIALKTSRH